MLNNTKKIIAWIFIVLCIFTTIIFIGNILTIGSKVGNLFGSTAETVLDIALIVFPIYLIFIAVISPIKKYDVYNFKDLLDDKQRNGKVEQARMFFIKKMKNKSITDYNRRDKQISCIREYLENCEKDARVRGKQIASFAVISTVLCGKNALDFIFVLLWNFRLINEIIAIYQIRPSVCRLLRLYAHTLFCSFFVESVDELMDCLDDIPLINGIPFAKDIAPGIATAYSCLRIANLTCEYIRNGIPNDPEQQKQFNKNAKNNSKEDFKDMITTENFKSIIKRICGMEFSSPQCNDQSCENT